MSEQHPELVAVPAAGVSSAPAEPAAELAEQVVVERDQAPADVARFASVLGPWRPVAELAGGTGGTEGGTGSDLLGDYFARVAKVIAEPPAELAAEPVPPPAPPVVPPAGTGAA
ncbi:MULTISPECIES: hypothetical protein [unclassified Streptomyces]|uniref:hypothetical protein n=1 Tax=unclassified Streptomyces TaxID=2593676 RepID=UPI002251A96C|nr:MULTISPECIES: hypothetical protein [unclassified Streptomyces]MCX4406135.1 hypothetical protein [Streptomyces sp. NBC_01764]MCX5189341.1 hypothetical protein [Streptomyces sp. NBC_00268]